MLVATAQGEILSPGLSDRQAYVVVVFRYQSSQKSPRALRSARTLQCAAKTGIRNVLTCYLLLHTPLTCVVAIVSRIRCRWMGMGNTYLCASFCIGRV